MKIVLIVLISISILFAKSDKLSHIPPTKSIFIDTTALTCNTKCMEDLLSSGEIFTFLSKYNSTNSELYEMQIEFDYYRRVFRIFDEEALSIKVAILIPQKSIRRYAISTVNSVIAYLLSKQNNFELKVFNSITEDEFSINRQLEKIKNENFTYLIAPVTKEGATNIINKAGNLVVYIPTINKDIFKGVETNVVFGGINYEKQIDALLKYSNSKIAYFSDGSALSNSLNSLNQSLIEKSPNIVYSKNISKSKINFKSILKNNRRLNNASIFMNTPLVKTSLISSQLRSYDIKPYILLSTQINYNPILLTLTQYQDRKNFYLSNSIGRSSVALEEINALFGHDIVYDWVNYSTSIGIDYFYSKFFATTEPRKFAEHIVEGQVEYDISILRPKLYKFEKELF